MYIADIGMNSNESYQQRFGRLQKRKESRIFLSKDHPVIAECKTEQLDFNGIVQNLSAEGIFIETRIPSSIGQEIAFTFTLPSAQKTIKATGVIVRKTLAGIGVNIKVIFRD
jgi:hypothetical protein